MRQINTATFLIASIAMLLSACSAVKNNELESNSQETVVTVSVKASDSGTNESTNERHQILVSVIKVEVQSGANDPVAVFANANGHQFNLASLKNDVAQIINVESIPAGTYDRAIVTLSASAQMTYDGVTKTIELPDADRVIETDINLIVEVNMDPTIEININVGTIHDLFAALHSDNNDHIEHHHEHVVDIIIHDRDHPSHTVMLARLEGTISTISDDRTQLVISDDDNNETTISIDDDTIIVIPKNNPAIASSEKLEVGMEIDVKGILDTTTDTVNASFIRVEFDKPDMHTEFDHRHGVVASIDEQAHTLVLTSNTGDHHAGMPIETTVDFGNSELIGFTDASGQAIAITVGQSLHVKGTSNSVAIFIAERIILLDDTDADDSGKASEHDDGDDQSSRMPIASDIVKLQATVLSIDTDSTISVRVDQSRPALSSADVVVNITDAVIAACGMMTELSASEIQVGDKIDVVGVLNTETQAIDAKLVAIEHDDLNTTPPSDPISIPAMKYGEIINIDVTAKTFEVVLPTVTLPKNITGGTTVPMTIKVDYANARLVNFIDDTGYDLAIANGQHVLVVGSVNTEDVLVAETVTLKYKHA